MSLMKREPFEDLVTFRNQMDHLMDSFLGREPFDVKKGQCVPNIDEVETDKEILVKAELPGVEEKDLSVTLAGNTLDIKGEKKADKEEKFRSEH
jgi:HSP20 family protein